MAPDKIYTFQDDGDRYWYKPEAWETPPPTRVEYIRKDTLLEWLVQRNKEINGETMALWRSLEIKELYDKIDSL